MIMEQKKSTPKAIRQRKFLLVLPFMALPFLTLFFWALGGGKAGTASSEETQPKGINQNLPDAKIKDEHTLNKMSYYDQAALDSVKWKQQIKSDPYYAHHTGSDLLLHQNPLTLQKDSLVSQPALSREDDVRRTNEAKVYQKLAQLKMAINQSSPSGDLNREKLHPQAASEEAAIIARKKPEDLKKLTPDDPELQQMNGLLEKVMDIQHPDRVNERLRENAEAHRGQVFAVSADLPDNAVSLLNNYPLYHGTDTNHYQNQRKGFYALDDRNAPENANTIQAVVHETQTVVNGSVIKLRLTRPVTISGMLIPKDNFLFGVAALNGERLNIKIGSIRYRNSLFPVALSVYDMDGLEGIAVPGAISREVAKESAAGSTENLGLNGLNTSFGAQAASAGVEAAKTLFNRKVKLIKVTVKAGYQVLLKDEKAGDNLSDKPTNN
jgi:conjugative transposon TraM protein